MRSDLLGRTHVRPFSARPSRQRLALPTEKAGRGSAVRPNKARPARRVSLRKRGGPERKLRGRPPSPVEPRSGPWRRTGSESDRRTSADPPFVEYDESWGRLQQSAKVRRRQALVTSVNACALTLSWRGAGI